MYIVANASALRYEMEMPERGEAKRLTLKIHADVLSALKGFGRTIGAESFAQVFGEQPYTVAAFSDYSESPHYETYVTHVVHYNNLAPLLAELKDLQREARGRTIDFKRRKDAVKARVIPRWMRAFRNHPGLCIAICVDRSTRQTPELQKQRTAMKPALEGFGVSYAIAERLVRAVHFLPVIAHLLRPAHRFLWVSDNDAILDGAAGREIGTALASLANQVVRHKPAAFSYSKPLIPEHELMLSLPDLVAGALAAALPQPFAGGTLKPDSSTGEILAGISEFADAEERGQVGSRFLGIVFRPDPEHRTVDLRRLQFGEVIRQSPTIRG